MKLIDKISIRGFRSIHDQEFSAVSPFTSLVGKNSSGKSNVLRALNLFFNNEVEPGKTLVFIRDHHDRPKSRKKKFISISVQFSLPKNFYFRQGIEQLRDLGDKFTIKRIWQLDQHRTPIDEFRVEIEGEEFPNYASYARQFLSLVSYRYIPNRTVPSELLRLESQDIANSILIRMKGNVHVEEVLKSLRNAAGRLLRQADQSLVLTGAPLLHPTLSTATTLGEMLTMSGFQATGPHGGVIRDEDWGAGHQSFFLYLVLYALDTNYGRFFGWKQASIWGVEEPESGLHRDLETNLAHKLREWAIDSDAKLQIIQTTHSPIFVMASDSGYWVELSGPESIIESHGIPELVRAAEVRGVTGWVHPILSFPWNPVVLVEGPIDSEVLTHVAGVAGYTNLIFLTLPQIDHAEARGKDAIISYINRHSKLIANRPNECPLVVLFDWDVSDQELSKARKAYGVGGNRYVTRMDPKNCSEKLGTEFKGIERFYPPEVIKAGHEADEFAIAFRKDGTYSISIAELKKAKGLLLERIRKVTDKDMLQPLISAVVNVQEAITEEQHNLPLN